MAIHKLWKGGVHVVLLGLIVIGITACDEKTLEEMATLVPMVATQAAELSQPTQEVETEQPTVVLTPSEQWYSLYFTDPQYPDNPATRHREILDALINVIDSSRKSLDIAIYELDLDEIGAALLRAKQRGVRVRMITDTDSLTTDKTLKDLKKKEIPIVADKRNPIMHNKFMIVDGQAVWTGSYNWTSNCTFRNNNNAIYIHSAELAKSYQAEFEEMFEDKKFGPTSADNTPYPEVIIEGTRIQVCFAPEDKCGDKVVQVIQKAQKSIRFMAFSFTHDQIGKALEKKVKAGVSVSGVFETRGSDTEHSEYEVLKKMKADVWQDGNPYVMHHKVFIIDEAVVVMGSFNFSKNADTSNDENMLIIYNSNIAQQFLAEYQKILQQAKEPIK